MRVAVVGLGKIGLPLAAQFARSGHRVTGVDVSEATVDLVNNATEPFPGETGLQDALSELVPAGRLTATTDYAEGIPGADAVVVVVPLFVDEATGKPDFGWMDAATASLAEHLTPGTLVAYETTLPVGTTRNRWKPMIEEISGLKEGSDFHLVFSPERVLTGRVFADLRKYPKLIGALNPEGAELARDFYGSSLTFDSRPDLPRDNGVWDMGSAEAAEMAKLAETTYRDVNIGLANQFAIYADSAGIDIHKVIAACNSQPYSHIHQPGIAVGGHCIPVYPRLYLSTDPEASIVRTARQVNADMPQYVVGRVEETLGSLDGLNVCVLGAAYRGGVKETAFSGIFATVQHLLDAGAKVSVHDPLFSNEEIEGYGWQPHELGAPADVVIVQADHAQYGELVPSDFPGVRVLFDGRRITNPELWAGIPRMTIGAPSEGDSVQ